VSEGRHQLNQSRHFVLGRSVETAIPLCQGEFHTEMVINGKVRSPADEDTWAQENDDPPPASYTIL
jgi:hypothetical protein